MKLIKIPCSNLNLIITIILLLTVVFCSGCTSLNLQTKEVITGDPITVSGKVNSDNDNIVIVLIGDDIHQSNELKFRHVKQKTFFRCLPQTVTLGDGYKLKTKTKKTKSERYLFTVGIPVSVWYIDFLLYKDNKLIGAYGESNNIRGISNEDIRVYINDRNFKRWIYPGFTDKIEIVWLFNKKIDNSILTEINVENGRYETQIDTSQLGGGKYFIEVYTYNNITENCCFQKLIDNYEVNIVHTNLEDLSISRINDIYGIPINAIVTISNADNEEKSSKVNLYLDGTLHQSKSFSIPPNSFTNVEFTLNDLSVGTHKVKVGTLEKTIEIKPVPNLVLHSLKGDIGIGRTLNVDGTSNSLVIG